MTHLNLLVVMFAATFSALVLCLVALHRSRRETILAVRARDNAETKADAFRSLLDETVRTLNSRLKSP